MRKPKLKHESNPKSKAVRARRETPCEPDLPAQLLISPSKARIPFTEAVGKTVAFVTYFFDDSPQWESLEVHFTDGTLFTFGLSSRVRVNVNYMESRRGDLEMIREYGVVDGKDAEG